MDVLDKNNEAAVWSAFIVYAKHLKHARLGAGFLSLG
jgi:hypothetical protein